MAICSDFIPPSITHLFYDVRPFPEKDDLSVVQVNEGHCWLCGLEIAQGIFCREIIRPSFTNLDVAFFPAGGPAAKGCSLSRRA